MKRSRLSRPYVSAPKLRIKAVKKQHDDVEVTPEYDDTPEHDDVVASEHDDVVAPEHDDVKNTPEYDAVEDALEHGVEVAPEYDVVDVVEETDEESESSSERMNEVSILKL